jgi:hypothetical protein
VDEKPSKTDLRRSGLTLDEQDESERQKSSGDARRQHDHLDHGSLL